MNNKELKQQYKRCQRWKDPEQWTLLAIIYYRRGYLLNAKNCLEQADKARGRKSIYTESVITDRVGA